MTPGEISLREYLERLFDEHAKEHNSHHREHELIQDALNKAERTMNQRLEGMNEFRAQLTAQNNTFATKAELEPIRRFQDKLLGLGVGLTFLNAVVTYLIVRVLMK